MYKAKPGSDFEAIAHVAPVCRPWRDRESQSRLKRSQKDYRVTLFYTDSSCSSLKTMGVDSSSSCSGPDLACKARGNGVYSQSMCGDQFKEFVYGAPAVGKDGATTGGGNGGDVTKHTDTRSSALSVYVSAAAVASALLISMCRVFQGNQARVLQLPL
ncbi:hypothetical protein PROFUN_06814 [Planoprotostelium fungivorum]|uniref:Uncharacterized protein n=1 Tax=Planoprotostelium fungivorum TaxID=1890364 RepID=A0A2P6NNB2_9EUKA|nr:hypothetical protein PROFUN_06814 [Planoprotostelium fungivorum]